MSVFVENSDPIGIPYWWQDGQPLPELSCQLPTTTELLIVGAGYTGLSAAITASDAGAKVVVVDAGIPGHGASTRNGGMFGVHPRLGFKALASKYGHETAQGIFNEAKTAFDFTSELIGNEKIQCQFDQCGRIQLAWTKSHLKSQRAHVAELTSLTNMSVEMVETEELAKEINSPCYFGGIRFPEHASLHPRQFHDGLLAAVLKRGVHVIQQCPIEHVEQQHSKYLATAKDGAQLVADKVVLATNGYLQGKFDWFARRVFPLPSFIIATEPLSPETISSLAPGRRMMVESRARHSYFRISPDGSRFIFGGRASITPLSATLAAQRLQETMGQVWPELANVKLSHSWFGNTGYTFSHMPQVGSREGLTFAMGYSGSGVALAPYLGAQAALLAMDDQRGITAYENAHMESRWFYRNGVPHFLKGANLWYKHVVDHAESFIARRDHRSGK